MQKLDVAKLERYCLGRIALPLDRSRLAEPWGLFLWQIVLEDPSARLSAKDGLDSKRFPIFDVINPQTWDTRI